MKTIGRISTLAACLALALPGSPVRAEEADDSEDDDKKTLEQKLDALITRVDSIKGRGEDTVEENGGEIEAAILSAAAMNKAAQKMCTRIDGGSYLVLSDRAEADAELAGLFLGHKRVLEKLLDAAAPGARPGGDNTKAFGGVATIGALADLFSAVISSEDTYSAISGTLNDVEVLSDMLAGHCGTATFEIKDDVVPDSAAFERFIEGLADVTDKYDAIRKVPSAKRSPSQKAALEAYESFLKALVTPIDGRVPIVALARTDGWFDKIGTRQVLHLSIDKSGGTLLKRKNLWTGLGAPSLGVTSGIIVRYRISNPSTGERDSGGVIYCTTKQASFRNVHELRGKLATVAHCEFPGETTLPDRTAADRRGRSERRKAPLEADRSQSEDKGPAVRLGYAGVL